MGKEDVKIPEWMVKAALLLLVEDKIRFSDEFGDSNVILVIAGDEEVKRRESGFEEVYGEVACSIMSDSENRAVRMLLEQVEKQIEEGCSDVVAVGRSISQVLEKCE